MARTFSQGGSNPTRIILFKEPLQAPMPKADYHTAV